jgi:hypothetical protein
MTGAPKVSEMSAGPAVRALMAAVPAWALTYSTSLNPSVRESSSATYWGAMQMPVISISLIRVVSGGGSAVASSGRTPTSPAVPASVSPFTKSRRLQLSRRSLMVTSSASREDVSRRCPHSPLALSLCA